MGAYPDLDAAAADLPIPREEILRQWDANPDLPLMGTTSAEDAAFAARLRGMTGRRFSVMTHSQNEYSIRGRILNGDGSWGAITTSTYFFGEGDHEVQNHAFVAANPLTDRRPHGVYEIPVGQDALYRNSFGLIHPLGNVECRSLGGMSCGGYFGSPLRDPSMRSSTLRFVIPGFRDVAYGFRLAEDYLLNECY